MAKSSALTGTEKKGKKAYLKAGRQIAKGKIGPETSATKLSKDYEKLYGRAGKFLQPQFQQQAAQAGIEQRMYETPEIVNNFGRTSGAGSSALNQALSAARTNLERQLANDFSQQQHQLAGNLLSQRETNKTNQMSTLAGLATSGLANAPQYLAKGQGANRGQAALSGAIQGAIQGGAAGGPWGAVAGGVIGGGAGYFGAQGDYSSAAKQAGGYLQNKFNPVGSFQGNIGGMNQLGG